MVFKARGCRTCVQRRIKCDSSKPICEKCVKANRSCIWDPNEQAGLRFQDESAFAKGKARRPRNLKDKSANTTVAIAKSPVAAPRMALSISLDERAFQYWVRTNVSHAERLHEAAHEWRTGSDYLRLRVQRLLRDAAGLIIGGYRDLMRRPTDMRSDALR